MIGGLTVRKYSRSLVAACLSLCCGCSGAIPMLARPAERLAVRFAVTDMTDTGADSALVSAVAAALEKECLYAMRHIPTTAWKTESWELRVAANPFRGVQVDGEPAVAVDGSLERRDYGPASPERLSGLEGFALLGPRLAKPSRIGTQDEVYVSTLQCRIALSSGNGFLLRRARLSDVRLTARAELDKLVIDDTAEELLFTLAEALAAEGRIHFDPNVDRGHTAESVLARAHDWEQRCDAETAFHAAGPAEPGP